MLFRVQTCCFLRLDERSLHHLIACLFLITDDMRDVVSPAMAAFADN